MYILPSTYLTQVNLASAMAPAASNFNPVLIASPPSVHALGGIHSNINSPLTNPDGSPIVASIGPIPTTPHPLEKVMGAHTASFPSATVITPASPSATAIVDSSKYIPKKENELRAHAEHFTEIAGMHRLLKEDAGRRKEHEQQKERERKADEAEKRKKREKYRYLRLFGGGLAFTTVAVIFGLIFVWVRANIKKMGRERLGKEVQGIEGRDGREEGERIEMGLATHWAVEESVRDGPSASVTVAPPAGPGGVIGASTEALRLDENDEREVQPVDVLAQPQYREAEAVSRPTPPTASLAVPGRVSAENPWGSTE